MFNQPGNNRPGKYEQSDASGMFKVALIHRIAPSTSDTT
jgi:hypothetical protein